MDPQADSEAYIMTDRETDRQTDRQTDRHTERIHLSPLSERESGSLKK